MGHPPLPQDKARGHPAISGELPNWELERIREGQTLRTFCPSILVFSLVLIGLIFGLVRYGDDDATLQIQQYYQWFVHVNIMVFVGFGFLMTFLRRYSFGAVALNMLAAALMYLCAILMIGATQQVFWNQKAAFIHLDLPLLIDAAFCAASGMIAFGAVIGKVTPTQVLWLVVAQVPLYAVNQHLVIYTFKALDMGGTICIHLFGAYYGLSASLMLRAVYPKTTAAYGATHPKFTSSYLNDVMSMVGTLFLWLYWPSFNGALASVPAGDGAEAGSAAEVSQFLCVVNTLISLLGATLSTFAASALMGGGRINMMHVQNSTLAGGVAMGAACTLRMTPGGALVVGVAAGVISVAGYQFLTPLLDRRFGLGDTCGVHNLHGMPALLGGLVAGLAALGQDSDYLLHATGALQLGNQVLAMLVTLGIAIGGGAIVGGVLAKLNPTRTPHLQHIELFDDGVWWHDLQVECLPPVNPIIDASKHSGYSVSRHNAGPSVHRANTGVLFGGSVHSVQLEMSQHRSRHLFAMPMASHPPMQCAGPSVQIMVDSEAPMHPPMHLAHLGLAGAAPPATIPENSPATIPEH